MQQIQCDCQTIADIVGQSSNFAIYKGGARKTFCVFDLDGREYDMSFATPPWHIPVDTKDGVLVAIKGGYVGNVDIRHNGTILGDYITVTLHWEHDDEDDVREVMKSL